MSVCGGSHPTYECEEPVTYTTLSGHTFCQGHAVIHEAEMLAGLLKRVVDKGDEYLLRATLEEAEILKMLLARGIR